jgi:hypothetical protein
VTQHAERALSCARSACSVMEDYGRVAGAAPPGAADGGVIVGADVPAGFPPGVPAPAAPGFPKSTVGASRFAPFVTWKYFRSLAPVIFAVSTAGN